MFGKLAIRQKHLYSSERQSSYLVGAFQPVSVHTHEWREEIEFQDALLCLV